MQDISLHPHKKLSQFYHFSTGLTESAYNFGVSVDFCAFTNISSLYPDSIPQVPTDNLQCNAVGALTEFSQSILSHTISDIIPGFFQNAGIEIPSYWDLIFSGWEIAVPLADIYKQVLNFSSEVYNHQADSILKNISYQMGDFIIFFVSLKTL